MPAPPPFPPCWSQGCRRRWPPWRLLAGDLASYSAQWLFWDLILDWRSLVSYFDQLFKSHFHFHLGTNVVIKGQLRFWWPFLIRKLSLASNLCVVLVSKKFVGWLCPKFVLQSACVQKKLGCLCPKFVWDAEVPNLRWMVASQMGEFFSPTCQIDGERAKRKLDNQSGRSDI